MQELGKSAHPIQQSFAPARLGRECPASAGVNLLLKPRSALPPPLHNHLSLQYYAVGPNLMGDVYTVRGSIQFILE